MAVTIWKISYLMKINVTVVSGTVESATLRRMECLVRSAKETTKAAGHSRKKQNAWYFLRTATGVRRLEEYNRTSHAEDASRQTVLVSSLTQAIQNAKHVKKPNSIAIGTWMGPKSQQHGRRENRQKRRKGIKSLDLYQCLAIRNATGAQQR
jgi:hypothetical protein